MPSHVAQPPASHPKTTKGDYPTAAVPQADYPPPTLPGYPPPQVTMPPPTMFPQSTIPPVQAPLLMPYAPPATSWIPTGFTVMVS